MDPIKLAHAKTRRAYDLAAQRYDDLFHDEMNEVDFLERRNPYDLEIKNERIFAIGRKVPEKGANPR